MQNTIFLIVFLVSHVRIAFSIDPLIDGPEETRRLGNALDLTAQEIANISVRFIAVRKVYCNPLIQLNNGILTNVSLCHPLTRLNLHKICTQEYFSRVFNMTGECPNENRLKICSLNMDQKRLMEHDILDCISDKLNASLQETVTAENVSHSLSGNNSSSMSVSTTVVNNTSMLSTAVDPSTFDGLDEEEEQVNDNDQKEVPMTHEETKRFVLQKLLAMLTCYEESLYIIN